MDEKEEGCHDRASDPSQVELRLLDLLDACRGIPRLDPRPASESPPESQIGREPELFGDRHDLFSAFLRPVQLATLEVDGSSEEERVRQTKLMSQPSRQR